MKRREPPVVRSEELLFATLLAIQKIRAEMHNAELVARLWHVSAARWTHDVQPDGSILSIKVDHVA